MEKGIIWYEDQLANHGTYELYMGYANILYNKYRYDAALKIYNKTIALRPTLINAYVAVMFLHEFRRVEKSKSVGMAKKILEMDPNSHFAHFIVGKNIADTDEKIKTLKASAQKFPTYIRLVNEVGLAYGAKKDHAGAIEWYKKCLQLAPNDYAQGYNNVAFRTQMLEKYEEALHYYYKAVEIDPEYKLAFTNAINLFNKLNMTDEQIINKIDEYPNTKRFSFFYYLGLAYYDRPNEQETAIKWFKRA